MKQISLKWLESENACKDGIEYYKTLKMRNPVKIIRQCIADNHFDWGNWLIVRLLSPKQNAQYAAYCAESVLDIFEREYPNDDRPRKAIIAAKNCINNPSAARAASADARATVWAAAAWAAARAAARAADAAADKTNKIVDYAIGLMKG